MTRQDMGRSGRANLAWLGALLVLAGALAWWGLRASGPDSVTAAGPRPRNVLLIVADTLRANRLGCYGYARPTSPAIDRLAARGTLYSRNYSQACWTLPSMVSIMSGRSVVDELRHLPAEVPVLGEALREAGFETAGFVANKCLGTDSGFERGFDTFDMQENVSAPELGQHFVDWHARRRAAGEARPFFAWVQFIDPHEPYEPAAEHDVFSGPRLDQARIEAQLRAAQGEAEQLSPDPRTQSLADSIARATSDSNRYDGEVLALDGGVRRVLAALESAGELDQTLVILCSDHGEMLYEHRQQPLITHSMLKASGHLPQGVLELFGHGHRPWYYEDLWNTPLVIAGPGMPAGARRAGLSANLEIFATILDALGLPPRSELEGLSLWGGREAARERVFAYGHRTSAVVEASGRKLIQHPRALFLLPEGAADPVELLDLARDPAEELDLSAQEPRESERLLRELAAWKARSPRYATGREQESQLRVLKRLGYVDDER